MCSATAGLQLGPYVLVARLGSGGMGQVWKARDTRLGRTVAIKLLNGGHGQAFEHEARAIAALNHPNICQIHDVGADYLVLEYVEGKPPGRCESAAEALGLAIQIAGALETAHRRNIIHRDLKPANILVTAEGQVKLLDFGIAKLTNADGPDSTATLDGIVKGTPAYMAPEQAQGQPVDARSDIFSFGAVCYEMLSGRRAFTGESAVLVMNSIVRDNPEPLPAPRAFERIVMRCLEKSPASRFQTMTEVRVALEQLVLKPSASSRPSIAVLPFANMSGDKDNEYFSDGLAEEIINALAQLPSLKVIARTSAFAFKGKQEDIRRIAETLGVDHVLEGSVRRAGPRIRVTAQLIAAGDGSHIWSQRYDREWADVFAIQDDIAESIVDSLRLKLALEPAALRRHTPNLAAYEALLKARHDSLIYTPEAADRCRKNYEQAIALDPQFAQAYAELGIQFLTRALPGIAPARDTMPLARAAAEKALQLDSCLPEAEAVLAAVAGLYDYDWQESGRRFKVAMAREPVPPSVRFLCGMFYLCPMGLPLEAIGGHLRGLEEDPLSFGGRFQLAVVLFQAGRFAEAEMELRQTMQFHPNAFQLPMFQALINAAQGKVTEAVEWGRQAYKMAPWHSHPPAILAGLLVQSGNRGEAQTLLTKLPAPETYGVPTAMTFFHFLSGEVDSAADWSERAIEQRDPRLVLGLQLPMAESFRAHPRGEAILRRINLLRG